jgi:hypothetical protein
MSKLVRSAGDELPYLVDMLGEHERNTVREPCDLDKAARGLTERAIRTAVAAVRERTDGAPDARDGR